MRLWHALAILVLGLVVAAGAAAGAEPVKITWLTTMWKINAEFHEVIVEEFNSMQDRIVVQMDPISSNAEQAEAFVLRVAAGQPPDIVDFHPNYFYGFVRQGLLLDLGPILSRHPEFDLDDIYVPVRESLTVDGKLYGIPQRISYYHLYYNVDHFNEAGVAVPASDWTDPSWNWDAYRQAAGRLSRDTNGDGVLDRVGGTFTGAIGNLVGWLAQGGARLFDPGYTTLALDSPEAIRTLEFIADGMTRGVFRIATWQVFAGDQSSMLFETPAVANLLRESGMTSRWEVGPLPQGPAGPATALQPVPYALVAASPHQAEAAEFFVYLFGKEGSLRQSGAGLIVQPRRSVALEEIARAQGPPFNVRAVYQALDFATPIPSNNEKFPEIQGVITRALTGQIYSGQAPPATAIAGIESQVEALLAEGR